MRLKSPLGVNVPVMILTYLSVLFCISFLAGCVNKQAAVLRYPEYEKIKLVEGISEIAPGFGIWESPALSPDGSRVAGQVELYKDPVLPYEVCSIAAADRDGAGKWRSARIVREGVYKKYAGRMELPVQPSFDAAGDKLVITQITVESLLSMPALCSMRSWVNTVPWDGGEGEVLLTHDQWGLQATELLQHPRYSPDGRYMAFYTQLHKKDQGIYILDTQTGKHYRLSDLHDKHPTWSPDGTRLYFHNVKGAGRHRFDPFACGIEQSVIGYFELHVNNDGIIGWQRRLMDEPDGYYRYHKHPVEVPGTNLLFFHGGTKPDGKKKLMVRLNEPGSQVFVLKLKDQGKSIKEAKHPASSFQKTDMVFVAKEKGEKKYFHLLEISEREIRKLEKQLIQYNTRNKRKGQKNETTASN